jgi:charged multivesicular body protein 2A
MEALFGRGKTPAEKLKEYQRSIKKSVREMDRERGALERQEKKLMGDIKKEAKAGRNDTAKIMARDLVRTRGYVKKMYRMKSHLEAVSLRLTTMQTNQQMAKSMAGVTKIMGKMTAQMNIPQMQGIMQEFEKQNEMMGMKEDMMNDAMDDAFADDEDEDEEDSLLGAIYAELGIEAAGKMDAVPTAGVGGQGAAAAAGGSEGDAAASAGAAGDALDAELQKRLDNLRRT